MVYSSLHLLLSLPGLGGKCLRSGRGAWPFALLFEALPPKESHVAPHPTVVGLSVFEDAPLMAGVHGRCDLNVCVSPRRRGT